MPHPVVHFEICGKDKQLLETFYKELFAWQITPVMEEYSLIGKEPDGIGGGVGHLPGNPSYVTFYVQVDDVGAMLTLAESKGARRAFGPQPIPNGGQIGAFFDPEDHLIGVMHRSAQQP